MPAKRRLTMRQLRQMLRLAGSGTSSREIAVMLGVARSTVQDNLKQAATAGLTWPLLRRTDRRCAGASAFRPGRGHARPTATPGA